jgi:L-iditol 2-dehydrogenase
MKALLLVAPGQLEIADVPPPEVGRDDVLVRVACCGICGSDVHGYDGSSGRRIPPLVMGHEAAGTVAAVGSAVRQWREGDRVTFDSMISNPGSWFSRQGLPHLCDDRRVLGVSCGEYRRHGAFAELVAVPQHIVYRLPDGLPFEHAAMIEPASVAVHAVRRAALRGGEIALVVGAGMIGQLCIQALRALDAGCVLASDPEATRRQAAQAAGAAVAFDPAVENVVDSVRQRTEGRGADATFEAVGAPDTVLTAVEATRKGGTVVLVGNIAPRVELPLQSVVTRELSLLGSCASNGEYPECLDLLESGAIRVDSLISAVAPLEEGPEWFRRLHAREPGLIKVLLRP